MSLRWACLSKFLLWPNSSFPNYSAYPFRDSLTQGKFIEEMDAVEMMPFPSCTSSAGICFGGDLCSAAVLGLNIKTQHKECASSHQTTVFPWERGRRNIVCCLQKFLLLFLAILSFPGKHLAAFEWKTTKHLKTAGQSWQHTCTPFSAPVGVLLNHWVGIKLEGCWDRRLTQSVAGKLCLQKNPVP